MAYKLHQHAVITGSLNSFCLACESFLRTDKDTMMHIEKPLHQKNLAMAPYFENFKSDGIRKVKMGYYCEYCNTLLPIASKVTLHVAESSHVNNRGALSLRPTGLNVIAFNNVLILEKAWHGLMEGGCLVCKTEFEDENLHKSSLAHGLNLVQKRVEFGASNSVYRQVDGTTFHCITCNIVLSSNMMTDHFNDSEHLKLYEKCRKEIKDINEPEKMNKVLTPPKMDKNKESTEIGETSAKFQEITNVASTSTYTSNSRDDKLQVIDTNNNNTSEQLSSEVVANFAQSNKITYNASNRNAYCRVCEKRFPSNLQSLKEHVKGGSHIKNITKINPVPKLTKELMKTFVKSSINVESIFQTDTVVNGEYCMNFISFLMLTMTEFGLRCQVCEVNVDRYGEDVGRHYKTTKHFRGMDQTYVVTSIGHEFIREVRGGLFHCGYCNIVVGSWEVVNDHLDSSEHKESRRAAEWRMEKHRLGLDLRSRDARERHLLMKLRTLRNQRFE